MDAQLFIKAFVGSQWYSGDFTGIMRFSQPGTLRILAKPVESTSRTAPWGNKILYDISWFYDFFEALKRLEAMLPISDGINLGLVSVPSGVGLACAVGQKIDAWPAVCPNGGAPSVPDGEFPSFLVCPSAEMNESILREAKDLRAAGIRVDTTVTWRPRDVMKPPSGEPPGGNGTVNAPPDQTIARVVGGLNNGFETTASIMAQEVAHNFGCVSGSSPYTDGSWHSKFPEILEPGASCAFDFVLLRPYLGVPRGPVADAMDGFWGRGKDLVLYNAYDWEHLRQKLVAASGIASESEDENEPEEYKKKVTNDLETSFADLTPIKVENYDSILSPKPGFEWYWTHLGFQLLRKGIQTYDPTTSVETIFSALEKDGITEVYAPIAGKPFPIIVNPDGSGYMRCELEGYP